MSTDPHIQPPGLARKLFQWYCSDPLKEEIAGDLEERFLDHVETHGLHKARRNYWLNVFKFFRWHTLKRQRSKSYTHNNISMFKNYFKIALRSAIKQKAFSLINLSGLAVGLTSFMLILLYVQHQLSFDQFHEHKERVFRVHDGDVAITANAMAPTIQRAYEAEVEDIARLVFMGSQFFQVNGENYSEEVLFTDPGFFNVFTFPLLEGNAEKALSQPNSMVFSQSAALKHFGTVNILGELFEMEGRKYQVTGVMKDLPNNSRLQFEFVAGLKDLTWTHEETWSNRSYYTYLLLADGVNQADFFEKAEGTIAEAYGTPASSQGGVHIYFQQLNEIYLQKDWKLDYEPMKMGDISYVYIFTGIAGLILLIACVNYINLSTSRSLDRAREVGLRKVVGAIRGQLIWQFLSESFLFVFGAIILSIGIGYGVIPYFEQLSGAAIDATRLFETNFLLAMLGLGLIITFLAGFYPALMLSNFKPVEVLKGSFRRSGKGSRLRQVLVVFQFSISIFLLVATLVVYKQLNFIQNKKLGYDREQVLSFVMDETLKEKRDVLRTRLEANPNVSAVSFSSHVPVNIGSANGLHVGPTEDDWELIYFMHADKNLLELLDIELLTGEGLETRAALFKYDNDMAVKPTFIVNRATIAVFNWSPEEAIGKNIRISGIDAPIQGVVENFHYRSMQQRIEPFVILHDPDRFYQVVVKVSGQQVKETLSFIEDEVADMSPSLPLNMTFLDDRFNRLYRFETQLGEVFLTFAAIAILIACLGMLGLISFVAVNRAKEIGIRKVLGASIATIMALLSKDFLKLVGISLLLALPLGYYLMSGWLQDYAYSVTLSADLAVIAAVSALVITMVTISYQALKTAFINPARVLRND